MPHVRCHDEKVAALQHKRTAVDIFKQLAGKDVIDLVVVVIMVRREIVRIDVHHLRIAIRDAEIIMMNGKIHAAVHEPLGNSIRLLIVGGAAMNPKIIEDFQALGFPMIQGYGMSENAPIIAVNRDKCSKPASVGPAMPGTEIRIDNPNEDGIGEIVVKGPSVMLGYYENPEATAEAIRDGWLYTGDYGYFDDEGYLYISGRKKNVIVTKNGKNIFPEEIEYILSEADFIAEVLVYGEIDEKTGDTFVKAEIYPDYGQIKEEFGKLTDEEVEKLIKHVVSEVCDVLPTYKRVTRVAVRDVEFEKTTTRKVKRNQKKLEKNAKNQDK